MTIDQNVIGFYSIVISEDIICINILSHLNIIMLNSKSKL